jgi:peptidoglycan/LPS O-acetylase OafA/YrhL
MAETVRGSPRLGWLDGLRGVAAMQVVLLHYVSAFFPLPIHDFGWRGVISAPLVFLYNGNWAVYLFFIISGVALTHAFSARPVAFLPMVMRRLIRLGLPMAAATVLAAVFCSLLPVAHVVAAARTGSPWFEAIGPAEISVAAIAHQIALEGLLVGFDSCSMVPRWMRGGLSLAQVGHAFDMPLWTLHIEFCGSLLVMLLVALRVSAPQGAYRVVCAILGCSFVLSPMLMFIVGHVIASHPRHTAIRSGQTSLGAVFLGSGMLLVVFRGAGGQNPTDDADGFSR